MRRNLLLSTDSYKLSHWAQYPPDTQRVHSYLESRGGMFDEVVFFGLQYYLFEYLSGQVFDPADIREAEQFAAMHFANPRLFNSPGWMKLFDKHRGRLPIRIRAVREGTVVPVGNVLMTIENTDDEFPWLTNFIETLLLKVWYPITVATLSREIKRLIGNHLRQTCPESTGLLFKLHDFGYRGVSSEETAAIGAAAHLVNFRGTDTLAGIRMLQSVYGRPNEMYGASIPAAEHSTITSWGKDREVDAYRNMLTQYPTGLVSIVADSWDVYNACREIFGGALRDEIRARDGIVVIRPDSGRPKETVLEVLDILGERFGWEMSSTNYRVLNKVRVIQGDGVNYYTIQDILFGMTRACWSTENIAFGMGGALLQQLNRDTQKMALKCSAVKIAGQWRDVHKEAPGKQSKAGRLALHCIDGNWTTAPIVDGQDDPFDMLATVFEDGVTMNTTNIDNIRSRAEI